MLKNALKMICNTKDEKSDLSFVEGRNIYIYGGGYNGRWVVDQFMLRGYKPIALIDDKQGLPTSYRDIKICNSKQIETNKEDILVVSFLIHNDDHRIKILERCREIGFGDERVYFFIDVFMAEYYNRNLISSNVKNIEYVYDLLSDEKSKLVYNKFFSAIAELDGNAFVKPDICEQYFDFEIVDRDRIKNFIDCGAFIGDTLEKLIDQCDVGHYIGFEPDLSNYRILSERIRKTSIPGIAFPCGTGEASKIAFFMEIDGNSASGKLSDQGAPIMLVSLDDCLINYDVDYIKMDIEGAEYDTILGAEQILKTVQPALAVCVYHRTDDMWRIPLKIHEINDKYRFYLRSYNLYGRETVLYCLPY